MSDLILYLLEASLLLGLFYALYALLLSKETFFQLNRIVLLAIPALSVTLPLIVLQFNTLPTAVLDQPIKEISKLSVSYHDVMASWEFEVGTTQAASEYSIGSWSWIRLLLVSFILTYIVGALVCLSRTAWSIRWIVKILSNHSQIEDSGVKIVKLSHPTAPFSFLNYLFVHEPLMDSADFRHILDHERIHIQEKHTYDLFYVQLIAVIFWFNPVVWLLLNSLKTTHEYIADRKIIESGYSVAEYQTLLLKQLISNNSYEFVHNFNLSFIKKRITMMTNKKSGWAGRTKVSAAIVAMLFCGVVIIQCNSAKEDQAITPAKFTRVLPSKIDLPVLPASGFKFEGDLSEALTFAIDNNSLRITDKNGAEFKIDNIPGDMHGRHLPVIMMVDKDQPMHFVREVHMALRVMDRRKLLYIGQTATGERVEVVIMLPPDPNSDLLKPDLSKVPAENLLQFYAGQNEGDVVQKKVYDFVQGFIAKGQGKLPVISEKAGDDVTYGQFLSTFYHIKEAYIQIYQERSKKMFNKDFYKTSEEEYRMVREGIPMNVSVAEE
jgi:hypothetical protein